MENMKKPNPHGMSPMDFDLEMLSKLILKTIPELQVSRGRPPYAIEIFQVIKKELPDIDGRIVASLLNDLHRQDILYMDKASNLFSLDQFSEEYQKFSIRLAERYPGFQLAKDNTLEATTSPKVNLKQLKRILMSKDMKEYEENQWIFDGPAKYLDGEDQQGDRICIATFPRTGNTFLRKLIQDLTGIATGSDFPINHNFSLQMNSFNGEGITDDQVWIRKSHHPIPTGTSLFKVNKIIITVRNPLDTIISGRNMLLSFTQDKEINEDLNEIDIDIVNESVDQASHRMSQFYNYYIQIAIEKQIPIHFIRYEDLIQDQENTLKNMFRFILNEQSIEGTVIEKRIQDLIQKGQDASVVYKPKTRSFNKSASKYTKEQADVLTANLEPYIYQFGYLIHPNFKNELGFLIPKEIDENKLLAFEIFKKLNSDHIKWMLSDKEKAKQVEFIVNEPTIQWDRPISKILDFMMKISIKE